MNDESHRLLQFIKHPEITDTPDIVSDAVGVHCTGHVLAVSELVGFICEAGLALCEALTQVIDL